MLVYKNTKEYNRYPFST